MTENLHCVKSIRIRSYSVRMRKNTDQNNSKYGHFLNTVNHCKILKTIISLGASKIATGPFFKFDSQTLKFHRNLKELRNYNGKLFLAETQSTF